jgi:hypothetical protein
LAHFGTALSQTVSRAFSVIFNFKGKMMKKFINEKEMITLLNHELAKESNSQLRAFSSNSKWFNQYGPFYIVNENNVIEAHGIDDLNKLATELGINGVTCQ